MDPRPKLCLEAELMYLPVDPNLDRKPRAGDCRFAGKTEMANNSRTADGGYS